MTRYRRFASLLSAAGAVLLQVPAQAAEQYSAPDSASANQNIVLADTEMDELLSLDIGQLTVTSVSKRPEKLSDAAAAIYVVTSEDIHRSGVTNIPDALRMVPGLDVAQVSSDRWAISSRGMSGTLASHLLVLIDGRTVYTPIFSGTYWDDQSTMLEDIDRIEVIRGPGGSLYGANAVNGVINIITKKAEDTQGNYGSVVTGTNESELRARHGGKIGDDTYYRVYAQGQQDASTDRVPSNTDNVDDWNQGRAGFRVDADQTKPDSYTLQGDFYDGRFGTENLLWQPTGATIVDDRENSFGGNVLGRWNHKISATSETSLQAYVDTYRRFEPNFDQSVSTADVQFQHNLLLNDRNQFIWGGGGRLIREDMSGTFTGDVFTDNVERTVLNVFAQDEYAIIPDKLTFTFGSKLEHNDYTGFEIEPNARLTWHPVPDQTVWAAVSRAVRTPSEIEDQSFANVATIPGAPPTVFALVGNPDQEAEEMTAYELGHRIQFNDNLSFDTALFYNDYDKLNAFGPFGTPFPFDGASITPIPFTNGAQGRTYGVEISSNWNVSRNWRLAGSYSYLDQDFTTDPGTLAAFYTEKSAPHNQFSVRSYLNLTDRLQWDNMFYYVGDVGGAEDYMRYDTRLGWNVTPGLEVQLVGRNLLDNRHIEYPGFPQAEIDRSALAVVSVKF